jgi:hypothetical protein
LPSLLLLWVVNNPHGTEGFTKVFHLTYYQQRFYSRKRGYKEYVCPVKMITKFLKILGLREKVVFGKKGEATGG